MHCELCMAYVTYKTLQTFMAQGAIKLSCLVWPNGAHKTLQTFMAKGAIKLSCLVWPKGLIKHCKRCMAEEAH